MGTYTWVATLVTAALALLLWLGPAHQPSPASVMLSPDSRWTEATLDDEGRLWELLPGEPLLLAPGSYRVTLFDPAGQALRHDITVGRVDVVLGDEPAAPASASAAASR